MSSSVRYHINPETGNANKCQAQDVYRCKFSKDGTVPVQHYESKEQAQFSYEIKMEAETTDREKIHDSIDRHLQPSTIGHSSTIDYMYGKLFEDTNSWTDNEKENLVILDKVAKILDKPNVSDNDFKKVDELIAIQRPKKNRFKRGGWSSNDPVYRDGSLIDLPKVMSIRKQWDQEESELRIPRDKSDLKEVFHNPGELNNVYRSYIEDNSIYGNTSFGDEKLVEGALDQVAAGDRLKLKANQYEDLNMGYEWETSYMKPDKRVFAMISKDEDGKPFDQKAYLALAFPNNELKDSLKEVGVKNVKVDPFVNGREVGNVYTVYQPDGNSRSFSVYEHRNTDSIVINGLTNWDKDSETLPYAGDNKHQYFAEISYGDTKQAANSLAFFLKEAQKGELPDDKYLADNAEKLDWTAILSKQLPGFKDWADKNGYGGNGLDPNDPRNS